METGSLTDLTYEQTKELEKNVELTRRAEKICANFKAGVKLDLRNYKGDGKFLLWSDSHNATYLQIDGDRMTYIADYLHNKYRINVTPADVFHALKTEKESALFLESAASSATQNN